MKLKSSRRQFLKDSSNIALTTGMMYGLENLLQILLQNAVANAETSQYPYRYVNFLSSGGPPRWFFDQPLNPTDDQNGLFIPGNFGTVFENKNNKWKPLHAGKQVQFGSKKHFMPPVWALKQGGNGTAYADLLKQCIMIRGVNMEINSHNVNRQRTIRPVNSTPSITGYVGEAAGKPITSIGHAGADTSNAYKSADGSAPVDVNRGSPIGGITGPFDLKEIVKYDDLDYSVQRALDAIDDYAKEKRLTSQGNEKVLKNSYDMFARNLAKFSTDYAALLKKYQAIVTKEASLEFPQVTTDLAKIKPDGTPEYQYISGKSFVSGDNLKTILADAGRPSVAHAFAFAEFALKEDLTSSLTMELGGNFTNVKGSAISQDQHFVGSMSQILFDNVYYRCLLGCLMEFRRSLTAMKLWDKTLVHMASEFSRTPTTSGRGADHGFESGSVSLFGGLISKPGLIGNIYNTPGETFAETYGGTWGHAANFLKDPQTGTDRPILNDDVVKTICEILQIPKLGTKGVWFVKNTDGKSALLDTYAKTANKKRA